MSNDWYVQVGGKEIGPLLDNALREMVAKRQLTPDDFIRKGTTANWVPASRVRGLFQPATVASKAQPKTTALPPIIDPKAAFNGSTQLVSANTSRAESHLISCPDCANQISRNAHSCPACGHAFFRPNRSLAIALAWILGGLGAHNFYLRKPGGGLAALLLCRTLIPAIVALFEGFQYLSMSDEEFARKFGSGAASRREESYQHQSQFSGLITESSVRWVFAICFFILAIIALPHVWAVSLINVLIGLSLAPSVQRSIDSLEIARKYGLSVGAIWLWLLGLLCLLASIGTAIRLQPWATSLLIVMAFCLIPLGWTWLSNKYEFVRQHQTKLRWIVGLVAMMLMGLAVPD